MFILYIQLSNYIKHNKMYTCSNIYKKIKYILMNFELYNDDY